MRINIRQLKSSSWVACGMAGVLAVHTFWDIYQGKKVEKRYEHRDETYFSEVLTRDIDYGAKETMGPSMYLPEDYQKIWTARIDGSVKPVDKPAGPLGGEEAAAKGPPVPKLQEVVKVSMLLWSADPTARIAAVEYLQTGPATPGSQEAAVKDRRLHLTQGEPLSPPWNAPPYNGRVVRIDPAEVVFQWDQGEVVLRPGLAPDGGGLPIDQVEFDSEEDVWAALDEQPADTQRRDDGSIIIGLKDQTFLAEGGAQKVLEEQLTARTITPSGGGRSSIELSNVAAGSLPARFGFQSGDRIISVNGHPLASVAEAINWGKNHPNEPQYHVVWERKGVQQQTTIHWNNQGS